jgi:hypothetical protein
MENYVGDLVNILQSFIALTVTSITMHVIASDFMCMTGKHHRIFGIVYIVCISVITISGIMLIWAN